LFEKSKAAVASILPSGDHSNTWSPGCRKRSVPSRVAAPSGSGSLHLSLANNKLVPSGIDSAVIGGRTALGRLQMPNDKMTIAKTIENQFRHDRKIEDLLSNGVEKLPLNRSIAANLH
jgi:hypothetical protein